jgi:hypothetical protein
LTTSFKLMLKAIVTGTNDCKAEDTDISQTQVGTPDPTLTIAPITPVPYCADATSAIFKFNVTSNGAPVINAVPSVNGVTCDQPSGSPKTLGTVEDGVTTQSECLLLLCTLNMRLEQ